MAAVRNSEKELQRGNGVSGRAGTVDPQHTVDAHRIMQLEAKLQRMERELMQAKVRAVRVAD